MTLVQRTLNVIEHFKKLFKNRFFRTLFLTVFVVFSIFTTLNVYAQESIEEITDIKFNTEEAWVDEQEFINTLQGVDSGSEDITTMQMNSVLATLHIVASKMCVSCFENGENIANNENISTGSKLGLLEIVDNGVRTMLTNPPSVNVASHLAQEWVPGYDPSDTSVYAVGGHLSGYDELQLAGVDVMWGRVRNMAYLMFVIIMIVIGFMIMFRNKINGQVMVTVGNAIPNVIIALVLVTFSFAIAGLIIDIGGLILIFISSIYSGKSVIDYTQFAGISNPIEISKVIFIGVKNTIDFTAITGEILSFVDSLPFLIKVLLGALAAASAPVMAINATLIATVLLIIVGVIVLYGAVKVWIMLIKSYISILLQVIGAPIIIMTAALPGNMKAFTGWMRSIAKHVLVFPATFALLNLPSALLGGSNDVRLRFPGSLIYKDPSKYASDGTNVTGLMGPALVVIIEIVLLYVASQIPAFLETVLPSNSSPAMQKAGEKSKEALSKMPLIGSIFGK